MSYTPEQERTAREFTSRCIDAAGFVSHDFGGNTIWLVRNDEARGLVFTITLANDSFPPDLLSDDCTLVVYMPEELNRWLSGELDLQDIPTVSDHRGNLAQCLIDALHYPGPIS